MIVPGGGLSPDGSRWIACRPDYFLPVEVLSALFRGLMLSSLRKVHKAGKLQFFADLAGLADRKAFAAFLRPWATADWVVYAKEPFGGPEQVLRYLSRYTHLHLGGLPCSRVTLRLSPDRSNHAQPVQRSPTAPNHPLVHLQVPRSR